MGVAVKPDLFRWARERSGKDERALLKTFPKLREWESGEKQPTLKQVEKFANATNAPVGYFFLPEPPSEPLPMADLRQRGRQQRRRPSPNLLDMIYLCQQRQEWYRENARMNGIGPHDFVGSAAPDGAPEAVARDIAETIRFDLDERRNCTTWEEALREFVDKVEGIGVLVMRSSIVGNNTRRPLDPQEFCGFTLADGYAPLIFVNAADTKSAQMFTLAHELAHVWLGASVLSDSGADSSPDMRAERWCNSVAAELLVPMDVIRIELMPSNPLGEEIKRLARRFKVSTLVILRRFLDAGRLSWEEFRTEYDAEVIRLKSLDRGPGGGNFYSNQAVRVGRRFGRALVESTVQGATLYRDALRLLGVAKVETLQKFADSLREPS